MKPEIYKVVADAVKKSLEGDGVDHAGKGGGLYKQNLTPTDGLETWYGGSNISSKDRIRCGPGLDAVEENDASEAKTKADKLLRARWLTINPKRGAVNTPEVSRAGACDAAIDDDFYVPDVSECIVYTRSSAGETEAQYRRRLLS